MLQHGAKRFHSAESDAADLAKFDANCLFFPARRRVRPHAQKGPAPRGLVLSGYENYRRVPAP